MTGNGKTERRRILDPPERLSEILFGLIMALTFTGSLSAATAGREDVRTMLIGAIGCNLAWGIVDGVMYLLNSLAEKGRGLLILMRLRRTQDAGEVRRIVADALPPIVASVLEPADLERVGRKLVQLPAPPARVRLGADDFRGALAVLVIVFLSTFPVVIPFLFVQETLRAMRLSNLVALAMLLVIGYRFGRFAGHRPLLTGFAMVGIGVVLVLITIALGG